jgi:hypothetical protein
MKSLTNTNAEVATYARKVVIKNGKIRLNICGKQIKILETIRRTLKTVLMVTNRKYKMVPNRKYKMVQARENKGAKGRRLR